MSALPLPMRTRLATKAGLAAAALSKVLGRGEGSVIGGRVTLAVDPNSLASLAKGRTIALVSGTNGKTTTTALLTAALETAGPVATNLQGANMYGGMVSALSRSSAPIAVLETDEGHLPKTLRDTNAQLVLLLNLSRDQLDRVGEVRMQAQKWRTALEGHSSAVVANVDDPLVVWAAQASSNVHWISVGNGWRLDAASCPNCGGRIDWKGDEWACTNGDLARPTPEAQLETAGGDATVMTIPAQQLRMPVQLQLPGEVNMRNAAMAVLGAMVLGADPQQAMAAVSASTGAEGRWTSTKINGIPVRLILAKNPAGWSEALRITRSDGTPLVVAINARVQDGRDPSWLWDVPFEQLADRYMVSTGERGRDLAVRLRYANVEHDFCDDLATAVRTAAARANGAEIDVLGNYSAFQDFRKLASR